MCKFDDFSALDQNDNAMSCDTLINVFSKTAIEYYIECAEKALSAGEDLPNIIIQNMSICYSFCYECCLSTDDPNIHYIICDDAYSACAEPFTKARRYPNLFSMKAFITYMFPVMIKMCALIRYVCPPVSDILHDIYNKGTEESDFLTTTMLTMTFNQLPDFKSMDFHYDCITRCMRSDVQSLRKAGVEALRAILQNHSKGECKNDLPEDYLTVWNTYISIYETFDEFPLHLIKDMWSRIHLVQQSIRSTVNTDYFVYYWRAGEDKLPPEEREFGRFGTYPVDMLLKEGNYKNVLLKSEIDRKDYYVNKKRRCYYFNYYYDEQLKTWVKSNNHYSRRPYYDIIFSGFKQIGMQWMEILFERGLKHNNPQVRMFILTRLLMVLPVDNENPDDYSEDEPDDPEPEPYYYGYDRNLQKHTVYHEKHGDEEEEDDIDSDQYLEYAKIYYSCYPPPNNSTKPGNGIPYNYYDEMEKIRLVAADSPNESNRFAWRKRDSGYRNYRHKVNMFVLSPAFLLHTLLPCLNNAALYKGETFGIGYLLTSYLIHYPCCVPEFWTDMLTIIASNITNPYALQFLLGSFHELCLPPIPREYDNTDDPYDVEPHFNLEQYIDWAMHYNRVNYFTSSREAGDVIVRVLASIKANVSRKSLRDKLLRGVLRIAFTTISIVSDKEETYQSPDDEWVSRADIYNYACIFNEIPYSLLYGMVEPVTAYLMGCALIYVETPFKKKDYADMSPSLAAWVMAITAVCVEKTFGYFLSLYTQYLGEDNLHTSCQLMIELLKVEKVIPVVDRDLIHSGYNVEWMNTFVNGYRKRYMNLLIDEIKDEDLPVFYCYFYFGLPNTFHEYVSSILTYTWHRNAKIDPVPANKQYGNHRFYSHVLSPFSLHLLKVMSTLHSNLVRHHVTIEYLIKTMEVLSTTELGLERPVLMQALRDCSHLIAAITVSFNK